MSKFLVKRLEQCGHSNFGEDGLESFFALVPEPLAGLDSGKYVSKFLAESSFEEEGCATHGGCGKDDWVVDASGSCTAQCEKAKSKLRDECRNLGEALEYETKVFGVQYATGDSTGLVTYFRDTSGEADDWGTETFMSSLCEDGVVEPTSIERKGKVDWNEACATPLIGFGESDRSLAKFLGVLMMERWEPSDDREDASRDSTSLTGFGKNERFLMKLLGVQILGESEEWESSDAMEGVRCDDSGGRCIGRRPKSLKASP